MKKTLLAALLCVPFLSIAASFEAPDGSVKVEFGDKACSNGRILSMLALIPEAVNYKWKEGVLTFQGRKLAVCYTTNSESYIVIDEEGDGGAIPKELVK